MGALDASVLEAVKACYRSILSGQHGEIPESVRLEVSAKLDAIERGDLVKMLHLGVIGVDQLEQLEEVGHVR